MADDCEHWTVDRRIPLALVFAIAVQTAGIVWWSAATSERLASLEKRVDMAGPQGDRLTRVEVQLDTVKEGVLEIKRILQQKP